MKRIFEFYCVDCDASFSKLVDDSVKKGVQCKMCNGEDTHRMISATRGFQFNGTGFYETDYKHK